VLGNDADARDAQAETKRIKATFNHKFLQPGTGRYDIATEACQAIPLYFGLVPADEKSRAINVLLHDIQEKQGHISTGIFGTKYMLNDLTDLGHADVAYEIANQRTFPGWGYMLANGATTLWETWATSDNVYSRDHPMFGSISEWFYKGLAGIKPAPDAVGFDHIILQPHSVGDLKWVKASYDSARGKIVSEWTHENGQFKLHVTIPVGAQATLRLPATENAKITEDGKPAETAPGVQSFSRETDAAILTLQSGDYHFVSKLK
jgi:alpha-L-rhamnosidase